MTKSVFLLGGTGSIGFFTQKALDSISGKLYGFSFHHNILLAKEIILQYSVKVVYCKVEQHIATLREEFPQLKLLTNRDELLEFMLKDTEIFIVINGIAGPEGLEYTYDILKTQRRLLLANKESIIIGGQFILECQQYKDQIIPIDSEHFSLFMLLSCIPPTWVYEIGITASGGPFLHYSKEQLKNITPQEALEHPVWKMGNNISLGSATLANKGLEVLEAKEIFGFPMNQIQVRIHPQAQTHAMVFLKNGSWLTHQYFPSMEIPIAHALTWPDIPVLRASTHEIPLISEEHYSLPNFDQFPMLELAYKVGNSRHIYQICYTIANDIANQAFLKKEISFVQIPDFVKFTLDKVESVPIRDINELLSVYQLLSTQVKQEMELFL